MNRFKDMTIYAVLLELIWMRSHPNTLYRVLESIGASIEGCGQAIGEAHKSGNADYLESVVDEECGVIENLFGAAFVTCQAEITAGASHVGRIHAEASQSGHTLVTCNGTKRGIMAFGSPLIGSSPYTGIQVINAFANYFKHNDEWNAPWNELPNREKQTVDVILAAGAQEYSTGNLRTGAEALGVTDEQLYLFGNQIRDWSSAIHNAYEKELKDLNLL
jgi:hypothetical protein